MLHLQCFVGWNKKVLVLTPAFPQWPLFRWRHPFQKNIGKQNLKIIKLCSLWLCCWFSLIFIFIFCFYIAPVLNVSQCMFNIYYKVYPGEIITLIKIMPIFLSKDYGNISPRSNTVSVSVWRLDPVRKVRIRLCVIYMFGRSPTSCLGVVYVYIDQNRQLSWSPPGSIINEVRMCQLNSGQREEGNVCINITASSQRGLGSGLTPGFTAQPDPKAT